MRNLSFNVPPEQAAIIRALADLVNLISVHIDAMPDEVVQSYNAVVALVEEHGEEPA